MNKGALGVRPTRRYVEKVVDRSFDGWDALPVGFGPIPTQAPESKIGGATPYRGLRNWVMSDGRLLSRARYSELFFLFGVAFNTGGEATDVFRLPDLRGRVPMGPDNMGGTSAGRTSWGFAASGGEQNHTLTNAEGPYSGWYNLPGFAQFDPSATSWWANTGSVGFGSGQPHNNMMPYQLINWIIKAI